MVAPDRPQAPVRMRRGALSMTASALLFAAMGVGVKYASARLPDAMVVFFRNAVGLALFLPWLALSRGRAAATTHFRDHLVRGLAGTAAMYFFFHAIGRLRLADALSLSYTMPIFMPLIARLWLGEKIPPNLGWVVGLGFAGVLLILKPGLGVLQPAALSALLSGLLGSVAQVGVRGLTRTEPPARIVFYFSLIASVVSAAPLLVSWRSPSPVLWGVLILVGLFATAAQLCLTRSYQFAPPARVGPFIYSAVVFAGFFDWVFWGKGPDFLSVMGAALIGLAGILVIRRGGDRAPLSENA